MHRHLRLATGIDRCSWIGHKLDRSPLDVKLLETVVRKEDGQQDIWRFHVPRSPASIVVLPHQGSEKFLDHPDVLKWKELEAETSLPTTVSYFDFELPVSGIVAGSSSLEVESLIREILTPRSSQLASLFAYPISA